MAPTNRIEAMNAAYPMHVRAHGLLFGSAICLVMFGILVGQVGKYYDTFRSDPLWKKGFVALVFATSIMDVSLIMTTLHFYFIDGVEDPSTWSPFTCLFAAQWLKLAIMLLLVHFFYGRRMWMLIGGNRVFGWAFGGAVVVEFICGIAYSALLFVKARTLTLQHPIAVDFVLPATLMSLAACIDLTLTVGLVYTLYITRSGFKSTRRLVNKVIRLTAETVLVSHIIALGYIIMWLSRNYSNDLFWAAVQLLSLSYAVSALATINARKEFREMQMDVTISEIQAPSRTRSSSFPQDQGLDVSVGSSTMDPRMPVLALKKIEEEEEVDLAAKGREPELCFSDFIRCHEYEDCKA